MSTPIRQALHEDLARPVRDVHPDRLLPGVATMGRLREHRAHLDQFGDLPRWEPGPLVSAVREAGLTGRGGAGFPTHRKFLAVAGKRPVVVGNGCEGEPASSKDRTLLDLVPHLVLDGLQVAVDAAGGKTAILAVADEELADSLTAAVRSRRGGDRTRVDVVCVPDRFLAGEETALVSALGGGHGLPASKPPQVYESGLRGRPTLVQNVETLAHLALIARFGAAWWRSAGTDDEPGTMLVSLTGAVRTPQVLEVSCGTDLPAMIAAAGGPTRRLGAVHVGGYHGAWVPASALPGLRLSGRDLRPFGARPGAGVLRLLPANACGLAESSRILGYLADESARQCGPCLNGLPAIAQLFDRLAAGKPDRSLPGMIAGLTRLVEGRGACHHPDGTIRLARSALAVFSDDVTAHLSGHCAATGGRPGRQRTPERGDG